MDGLVAFAMGDLPPSNAALVAGHLEKCSACARKLGDYLQVVPHPRTRWQSGPMARQGKLRLLARWRPLQIAAGVVLLVMGTVSAMAGFRVFRPPMFVTAMVQPDQLVLDAREATGLKFELANVSGQSMVRQATPFVTATGRIGAVVLVERRPERVLELCSFDELGKPLWAALGTWPDWMEIVGPPAPGVPQRGLHSIVTRRTGDEFEESAILFLDRRGETAALVFDPITGSRRAAVFHQGPLQTTMNDVASGFGPLPAPDGGARNVVFGGSHWVGDDTRPCITVLGSAGRVVQEILLPRLPEDLSLSRAQTISIRDMRIEWNLAPCAVVAVTEEGLIATIPVREGKLIPAEATLDLDDEVEQSYNRRHPGITDALRKRLAGDEKSGSLLEVLAETVQELEPANHPTWMGK